METGVSHDPPPAPMRKIVTVASIAAGIQFGWALQLSLLTPYVQTLGVPHTWATFIWLCGPMSGLLVQPTVGYYSDRCYSRYGRRRPYITAGAAVIIIAVFLIGYAKDIGFACGDPIDAPTKPRAVVVFVIGFWCLDVANNMLQGPCRALLADLSAGDHKMMRLGNSWFAFFMAVGNVLGYLAGSIEGLHKILPFTRTATCDIFCANLKTCFMIDVVVLMAVTVNALMTVSEKPLMREVGKLGDQEDDGSSVFSMFTEIGRAFKTLKKPMWLLLLVTTLNWIAWFPFLLFDTDWMGREVYGGDAEGTAREKLLYEIGVRSGSLGLLTNSVVLGVYALILEQLGRAMGGVHRLWGVVNFILCAALAATVAVSKVADHWRLTQAPNLPLPPTNVKGGAFAIFGALGIPLAVTYSIPFALASIYSASSGAGQGLSLGVLNVSIVFPQIVVSVVAGPLDLAFGGGNLPAFVMGAISAVVSGVMAIFLLPKPPKQVSLSAVVGGH